MHRTIARGAIVWSYAALVHLSLPLDLVLHDAECNGEAARLRTNFAVGRYLGVPILEWRGTTEYHQHPEHGDPLSGNEMLAVRTMLRTTVTVFESIALGNYESGITCPYVGKELDTERREPCGLSSRDGERAGIPGSTRTSVTRA